MERSESRTALTGLTVLVSGRLATAAAGDEIRKQHELSQRRTASGFGAFCAPCLVATKLEHQVLRSFQRSKEGVHALKPRRSRSRPIVGF